MAGGWANSDRASRLPRNWHTIRRRILKRDPVCRCAGCPRCNNGCLRPSAEVDHVQRGDDHSESNLQGLCSSCHLMKTARERTPAAVKRRRPSEQHPGLLPPGGGHPPTRQTPDRSA